MASLIRTPTPASTHSLARSIKGRPSSLVRTRYCQAPAPAQPRSNTAQPGDRDGTERGLRMRVSRAQTRACGLGAPHRGPTGEWLPGPGRMRPLCLSREEITCEL